MLQHEQLLLAQVLGHLLGRELCLTNVPEIFGQVQRLVLDQRGEQRDVGRFASTCGQIEPDLLELFAQFPAAVFALCAPQHAAQQRRVQTLGRRQSALHLAHGHLVLGSRRQQRQPPRHRAKGVRRRAASQAQQASLAGVSVVRVARRLVVGNCVVVVA